MIAVIVTDGDVLDQCRRHLELGQQIDEAGLRRVRRRTGRIPGVPHHVVITVPDQVATECQLHFESVVGVTVGKRADIRRRRAGPTVEAGQRDGWRRLRARRRRSGRECGRCKGNEGEQAFHVFISSGVVGAIGACPQPRRMLAGAETTGVPSSHSNATRIASTSTSSAMSRRRSSPSSTPALAKWSAMSSRNRSTSRGTCVPGAAGTRIGAPVRSLLNGTTRRGEVRFTVCGSDGRRSIRRFKLRFP